MNRKWKLLAILMTACMVITLTPTVAFAEGEGDDSFADLQALIDEGDSVVLNQDYVADTDEGPVLIGSGKTVTIDLNGHTIDRGLTEATEAVSDGRIFTVSGTLTIKDTSASENGKITGGFSSTNGGAILVNEGGVLNLEKGEISGNKVNYYQGSGGGAIYINKGSFNMSGGVIKSNEVDRVYGGGGAVYCIRGTITMSGGEISGNTVKPFSNGGGGVYLNRSTMKMTDGTISGNKAEGQGNIGRGGGVYASTNSVFDMSGGTISGNQAALDGGGVDVCNESTFNMSGGEISGNKALGEVPEWGPGNGGGVIFSGSAFNLSGDAVIKDNEAKQAGGGVYVKSYKDDVTFTMNGGTISGNTAGYFEEASGEDSHDAAVGEGGGVCLTNGVKFVFNDGTITRNKAFQTGGGIMVKDAETFALNGGIITGNYAHGYGGGVYFDSTDFSLSGKVNVTGNKGSVALGNGEFPENPTGKTDNTCLVASMDDSKSMKITGDLDPATSIGLWVWGNMIDDSAVITSGQKINESGDWFPYFRSDVSYCGIVYEDGVAYLKVLNHTASVGNWKALQDALTEEDPEAQDDSVYKNNKIVLTDNIEAADDDTELVVPDGQNVTIDLNGFTIDRKLEDPRDNGYVCHVLGHLVLQNDGVEEGVITGGNNTRDGGGFFVAPGGSLMINKNISIRDNKAQFGAGVYTRGTFAMNYGTVSGNVASSNAGGVGVYGGGMFVSYKGEIINNEAQDCSGVYVRDAGSQFIVMGGKVSGNRSANHGLAASGVYIRSTNGMMLAGDPEISGNMNGENTERNVSLDKGKTIAITEVQDALDNISVSVYVQNEPTPEKPVVFTSGLNGRYEGKIFESEQEYTIIVNEDGEAAMVKPAEGGVVFDANGGKGQMEKQVLGMGSGITLTANAFTRSGYRFTGWNTEQNGNGTAFEDGSTIPTDELKTLTEDWQSDLTLYAQWKKNINPADRIYTVDLEGNGGSGFIMTDKGEAKAGEIVTIELTPDPGWSIEKLTVTQKNGETVPVMEQSEGVYTFEMPAANVTASAFFFMDPDKHDEICPSKAFDDLDTSQWYHEDTDYVIEKGIMNGVKEKKFDPSGLVTRAMMVTMLWRMDFSETGCADVGFDDVEAGSWYAEAVNWAAEHEIVKGMSKTSFAPNDSITREQFATIMYRYADYKGIDLSASPQEDLGKYTDAGDVSDWAMESMQWAVGAGLINGMTETTLAPKGNATRAQAAAIFHRFCENIL